MWLGSACTLADAVSPLATPTVASERRALARRLDDLLARATTCDLVRAVRDKIRRSRNQILTFACFPGKVEPANNACGRNVRPAVIQRKTTYGYRSA